MNAYESISFQNTTHRFVYAAFFSSENFTVFHSCMKLICHSYRPTEYSLRDEKDNTFLWRSLPIQISTKPDWALYLQSTFIRVKRQTNYLLGRNFIQTKTFYLLDQLSLNLIRTKAKKRIIMIKTKYLWECLLQFMLWLDDFASLSPYIKLISSI